MQRLSKMRRLRLETLEVRALLSAVPLADDTGYEAILDNPAISTEVQILPEVTLEEAEAIVASEPVAMAASAEVANLAEFQAAIANSNVSQITFSSNFTGSTTLSVTSQLVVTRALEIDASNLTGGLTLDGGSTARILYANIANSGQLSLKNVHFTNGVGGSSEGGGGIYIHQGSLSLENCDFSACSAGFGGGVYVRAGSLILTDCDFTECSATSDGGAVYVSQESITLTRCNFTENSASNAAGAVYFGGTAAQATGCAFTQNEASFGAGFCITCTTAVLEDCDFLSNTTTSGGGSGIYLSSGILTLQTCDFTSNSGPFGVGIRNVAGTLIASGCDFTSNSATAGMGGACMLSNGSSGTFQNCKFVSNSAANASGQGNAGAIYSVGTVNIDSCQFYSNSAQDYGGAASFSGGTATVSNSIFAGNTGSGVTTIYISGCSPVFRNITLVNNGAPSVMAIYSHLSNVTFYNSILYGVSTFAVRAYEASLLGASNLSDRLNGTLDNFGTTTAVPTFTNLSGTDWTQWDFTLTPTSAGINGGKSEYALDIYGNALTTDVYGNERICRTIDIGAVETELVGQALTTPTVIASVPTSSQTTVLVGWQAVEGALGYTLRYRYSGTELTTSAWFIVDTLSASTLSYALQNLFVPGTTVEVQVCARGDGVDTLNSLWSDVQTVTTASLAASAPITLSSGESVDVFQLASLPGASRTMYLDFTGHLTSGTSWNTTYNVPIITSQPFELDGDTTSFSTTELQAIYDIWRSVAEDYAPFQVNVTTIFPGLEALKYTGASDTAWGVRCVISNGNWVAAGGISYTHSFDNSSDLPCFVFPDHLSYRTQSMAVAAAHELGHSVGLGHRGLSGQSSEYFAGANGWGPIMGAPYHMQMTQWTDGTYASAQSYGYTPAGIDDLAQIAEYLPYKDDDHASFNSATGTFSQPCDSVTLDSIEIYEVSGIIERNTDNDVFELIITDTGTLDISVAGIDTYSNLDVYAELFQLDGTTAHSLYVYDSTDSITASFEYEILQAGTYYLLVRGDDKVVNGTTYYTSYGSLGTYDVSVAFTPTLAPEALPAPANLRVTTLGPSSLQVQWDTVENADSYFLEVSTNPNFTTSSIQTLTGNSATLTGLSPNTTCYIRVKSLGTGLYSDSSFVSASGTTDKATITGASVTGIETVYDGLTHTLTFTGLAENDEVTYSTEAQSWTDVTNTPVTVTISRANHYDLILTANVVITPQVLTAPSNVQITTLSATSLGVTFDDNDHASSYEIQYYDNAWITCGSTLNNLSPNAPYDFRVKCVGTGNYSDSEYATASGTTDKATITGVSATGIETVYDGLPHTLTITGLGENDEVTYSTEAQSWTDVTNTPVTVTIHRANHYDLTLTANVVITPQVLTAPSNVVVTTLSATSLEVTYDNNEHASSYEIQYYDNTWITCGTTLNNLTPNTEYQFRVKCVGTGNYSDSGYTTASGTTDKATITGVSVTGIETVYDGLPHTLTFTGLAENDEVTYSTEAQSWTDVTNTPVTVTISRANHYDLILTANVVITPQVLTAPSNVQITTLSATSLGVTFDDNDHASSYEIQYYDNAWITCGSTLNNLSPNAPYDFRVKCVGTGNYSDSGYTTASGTTDKATITGVSVTGIETVYDGLPHTLTFTGLAENDEVTYSTEAQTWTDVTNTPVTVTIHRANHYDLTLTANVVITPQVLTAPSNVVVTTLSATSLEVTYDNNEHASSYEIQYYDNAWITCGTTLNNLTPNTEYQFRVKCVGTGNYSDSEYATASGTTDKATITGVSVTGIETFYDGLPHTLTITGLAENDEVTYSTEAQSWTDVTNTPVTVTISRANHYDLILTANVVITPQVLTAPSNVQITTLSATSLGVTYDNNEHASSYEIQYLNGATWTTCGSTLIGLNPNTSYDFRVKCVGTGNYSDSGYTTASGTTDKATITGVSVTGIETVYDGLPHTLTFTGLAENDEVTYSTEAQSWTDVTNTPVTVTIHRANHYDLPLTANVVITPQVLTVPSNVQITTLSATSLGVTYDNNEHASSYEIQYYDNTWITCGTTLNNLTPNTEYQFRVKCVGTGNYSDSGYTTASGTTDKATITGVSVTGIETVYDGLPHTLTFTGLAENDEVTYSTEAQTWTDVTNTPVTVTIHRANHYDLTLTANVVITPQVLTAPSNVVVTTLSATSLEVTYDNNEHASSYEIQYYDNAWITCGTTLNNLTPNTEYQFRVKCVGTGNYSDSEYATASGTTDKATITGVSVTGIETFYDGLPHTLTITGLAENDEVTYSTEAQSWTDVTNTPVTVTISRANHYDLILTANVVITPQVLTAPSNVQITTLSATSLGVTYDNNEHASSYEIQYLNGATWTTCGSTLIGLNPNTSYDFRVKCVGTGNYSDSGYTTASGTTDKATITGVSVTGIETVYDGLPHTLTFTGLAENDEVTYSTEAQSWTDVTNTPVTVTIHRANHYDLTLTANVVITPQVLTVPSNVQITTLSATSLGVTYDNNEHASSYEIQYYDNTWITCGTTLNNLTPNTEYQFRVKCVGTGNYSDSGYTTASGTTDKATITGVSVTGIETVYDGLPHTLTITGLAENDEVTYSTEAQTWTDVTNTPVTVTISRANHYDLILTANVVITPQVLTAPSNVQITTLSATSLGVTYDNNEHASSYEIQYYDNTWITCGTTLNNLTPNTEYQFRVKCVGTGNYSDSWYTTASGTTDKATITGVSVTEIETVYDGLPHTLTITGLAENDEVTYSTEAQSWTDVTNTPVTVTISRANHYDLILTANVVITPQVLTVPSNVQITTLSATSLGVTYDNNEHASSYEIQYYDNTWVTCGSTLNNLTPNTEYQFRVKCVGTGNYSDSSYTTASGTTDKATITGVSVTGIETVYDGLPHTLTFTGLAENDEVTYSTEAQSWTDVTNTPVTVTIHRANHYDLTLTANVVITSQVLTAPSNVQITTLSATSLGVTYDNNEHAGSYEIQYYDNTWITCGSTLNNLTPNTEYQFRVKCVGIGNYSDSEYTTASGTTNPLSAITMEYVLREVASVEGDGSLTEIPVDTEVINSWNTAALEVWADGAPDSGCPAETSWEFVVSYNSDLFQLVSINGFGENIAGVVTNSVTDANRTTATVQITWSEEFRAFEADSAIAWIEFSPNTGNGGTVAKNGNYAFAVNSVHCITTVQPVFYDMDKDAKISVPDLIEFVKAFGEDVNASERNARADFDSNGEVGVSDLILFVKNFGLTLETAEDLIFDIADIPPSEPEPDPDPNPEPIVATIAAQAVALRVPVNRFDTISLRGKMWMMDNEN